MANNGKKLKKNDKKPQAKRVRVSQREYHILSEMYKIRIQDSEIKGRLLDESVKTNLEIINRLEEAVVQSNINWRIAAYSFAGLLIQTIIAINAIL